MRCTLVARLISDVLSDNRDDPDFSVSLLTCSITYMFVSALFLLYVSHQHSCRHPQHFRSDVLITFHKPVVFSAQTHPELLAPVDFSQLRRLTAQMRASISAGTLDAPSWDAVRCAKLAARMYAPLGTRMVLGDFVRISRRYLDAFKWAELGGDKADLDGIADVIECDESDESVIRARIEVIKKLRHDLKVNNFLAL